jgi:hypothetical protein
MSADTHRETVPDSIKDLIEVISDLKDRVSHIEHVQLSSETSLASKATWHIPSAEECPGVWSPCKTPSEVAFYASFWHLH